MITGCSGIEQQKLSDHFTYMIFHVFKNGKTETGNNMSDQCVMMV